MNKSFLALIVVLVLSVGMTPAFASHIGGQVQDSGTLVLNGAWVNSENTDQYRHTTQPSSGDIV